MNVHSQVEDLAKDDDDYYDVVKHKSSVHYIENEVDDENKTQKEVDEVYVEKKSQKEIDDIKAESIKRLTLKIEEEKEFKKMLLDSELKFRYFRNYKYHPKTSNNHGGVICIGYKILREDASGIKLGFSVSFCSPKDHFSRTEAKRQILKRYRENDIITAHIDFANSKQIDDILRLVWNSQKIPAYTIGIAPVAQGKEIKLKPWMMYLR